MEFCKKNMRFQADDECSLRASRRPYLVSAPIIFPLAFLTPLDFKNQVSTAIRAASVSKDVLWCRIFFTLI
jgi:hypothetical protein